jgi:Domain of unknown function (DUF4926)
MALPKLLDTVAVLISLNADRLLQVESEATSQLPLPIGLVGTVVEVYAESQRYLVEFADGRGCEYAMSILSADELLVVHLELESVDPNLIAA